MISSMSKLSRKPNSELNDSFVNPLEGVCSLGLSERAPTQNSPKNETSFTK